MKFIASLIVLISTSITFANTEGKSNVSFSMAGLEGGFRWSSADAKNSTSNKQTLGFQIGGSGVFDIATNFAIKSGLFYTERAFKNSFGTTTEVVGKITYFDIPVLLMFKFEDYAGVYIGPALSFKMSDEVSQGTLKNIKGSVVPIVVGGQFKFASNMGVNIYFESVSGALADDLENSRSVGANLLVTFD